LAGGLHFRTQKDIDGAQLFKREDRSLDRHKGWRLHQSLSIPGLRELMTQHRLGRQRHHGDPCHFGDEWHGTAGPRVDLEDVHPALVHDKLDVDQTDDAQSLRDAQGVLDNLPHLVVRETLWWKDRRRVARVHPRPLYVLHDAGNEDDLPVAHRVDVDFLSADVPVDQHRVLRTHFHGKLHVLVELSLIVDDLHGATAEDVRGAHHHGKAHFQRDAHRLLDGGHRAPF